MSDTLVDSSVWVDFLRGDKKAIERVDPLLVDDRVAVCGLVVAEVVSGAITLATFHQLRQGLHALVVLSDPPDLWSRVAEARFQLARHGVQAHLVDLAIAMIAHVHGHVLLTRDRDFAAIRRVVPLDLVLY